MNDTLNSPSYKKGLTELRSNLETMLPQEALSVFDRDAEQLQKTHTSILKLNVGDSAPNFTLSNAVDKEFQLSEQLEKGKVVLVFYRGTWCPYCNLQLAHYQNALNEIKEQGAQLVSISPQTPDQSLTIAEKNALKFEVLSDIGNSVARQYTTVFKNGEAPIETMTKLGFDFDAHYTDDSRELPVPAVFIIGQDSKITFASSTGGDYRERVEACTIINALKNSSK